MSAADELFAGGGELGELMRKRDWAATPLGPVEGWPRALRTAVRIMLTSRQPMFVWWGDQLINLYNDAYLAIVGGKHPLAPGPEELAEAVVVVHATYGRPRSAALGTPVTPTQTNSERQMRVGTLKGNDDRGSAR